ncbi:MAG: DUF434 domain-containing protein [Saprospiraceae bacterium]|nr:DUF434 domain-containing protein [Saprospiraceae bacterium]
MSTQQRHRGAHPNDALLFDPGGWGQIVSAAKDLVWLWSKGYPENAAKTLVSDHFNLTARQRKALARVSMSTNLANQIGDRECARGKMGGRKVAIDGFNMLIYAEALISHAYIFQGLDGVFRDIASVHGSYKKVEETVEAVRLIGNALTSLEVSEIHWFLDAPVSNSGRLKSFLLTDLFDAFSWNVEVVRNPDRHLLQTHETIICSNDRMIISKIPWLNLSTWLIDFGRFKSERILEADWNNLVSK